jgi:thiol-disulfide isomerase/thioredoxin
MALQQFVAFVVFFRLVSSQKVLDGTQANFDNFRKKYDRMLVQFSAPGCTHCDELAPEYEKAAKQLAEQGMKTKLVKIDSVAEKWVKEAYDIQGFPTFKYFTGGRVSEYRPVKIKETAETLVSYVRKRELGLWVKMDESDAQEFRSMAQDGEFVVVARVKKGSVRDKAYRAALDSLFEYRAATLHFGLVLLDDKADAKEDSSLSMRRQGFDEEGEDVDIMMSGPWSDKNVLTWILENTYPAVAKTFTNASYNANALKQLRFLGLEWEGFAIAVASEGDLMKRFRSVIKGIAFKFPKFRFVVVQKSDIGSGVENIIADGRDGLTVITEKKTISTPSHSKE